MMRTDLNFSDCVIECCRNRELVMQFDRLNGSQLSGFLYDQRTPIVRMIDQATGYEKVREQKFHEEMQQFISFVFEFIWMPLKNKSQEEKN